MMIDRLSSLCSSLVTRGKVVWYLVTCIYTTFD